MKSKILPWVMIGLVSAALAEPPSPEPVLKKSISLEMARASAEAAIAEAKRQKLRLTIAVVDEGGHLVYLARMDGTPLYTVDIARRKAWTAVATGASTTAAAQRLAKGELIILAVPEALASGGGLPIIVAGELLGGIGVSGAEEAQDEQIGQAGLAALRNANGR